MRQKVYLLLAALLAAAGVFAFISWSSEWDNPPASKVTLEGEIVLQGESASVAIECLLCPTTFTESKEKTLTFNVKLKLKSYPSSKPKGLIYVYADAGGAVVKPAGMTVAAESGQLTSEKWTNQSMPLNIMATNTGPSQVTFHFEEGDSVPRLPLGAIIWPVTFQPRFISSVAPIAYSAVVFVCTLVVFLVVEKKVRTRRQETEKQLKDAKDQWEKARIKLEAYFDGNLLQVNLVFWVAVVVMAVGFCFVLGGVLLAVHQPEVTSASLVAALSGIITQFIGATFMAIYRSTVAQANEFVTVLERINRVGMAVEILGSIPDEQGSLKNASRADTVKLLASGLDVAPGRSTKKQEEEGAGR